MSTDVRPFTWPSLAPYPRHSLSQFLERTARRLPDKPALIDAAGTAYTYGRLWRAARRLAAFVQRQANVRKGETVAIAAPNCPEWAVALHGALLAGATVTSLNPLYREREIVHQLTDAEAVAVFAAAPARPALDAARSALPRLRAVFPLEDVWELAEEGPEAFEPPAIDPQQDLALLLYSSGTTGLPKGVMLSHANAVASVRQLSALGLVGEASRVLALPPFFHIFGLLAVLNTTLATGATATLMPRFDPEQVLHLIARGQVTDLPLAPPALGALIHQPGLGGEHAGRLRYILSGGAPLALELSDLGRQRFGCPILQGYGLTECAPANHTPLIATEWGSVGPAVGDTEEKVVDLLTRREVPAGEPGELLVRGPQVMRGYWKNPEATAETILPGGWLRSGDIVRVDANGCLFVLDRAREIIKYKGYQVAPAELEGLLLEHPAVLDAAVVAKPAAEAGVGEVPKAFVVLKDGQPADAAALITFVAERTAPYKRLRELQFVAAIPKSPSGKILRRLLIEHEQTGRG